MQHPKKLQNFKLNNMKSYKVIIGTETRIIKAFELKEAKVTAQNIKFWNGYKGKTTVVPMSFNEVFNYLKSI